MPKYVNVLVICEETTVEINSVYDLSKGESIYRGAEGQGLRLRKYPYLGGRNRKYKLEEEI